MDQRPAGAITPIMKCEPGLAPIVEPGLELEEVTKSEIQKCATETGRRNAPKTAVCCSSPAPDRREALS